MVPTEQYRARVYRHYGLTCPPRWATLRDFSRPTYGPKVARVAAALGTPLMPWQRYAVDVGLEIDPVTKVFAYRKIGITVPRQSGKTSIILPVASWRAMAWQRQRIVYAAQSGTEARKKWEDDHVEALLASRLAPRIRVRRANGRESIIWRATRSMHGITTNTEKAGHGPVVDLGMADEYFAQVDYRIEGAWSPSMITNVMAQLWWLSTAGTSKSLPLNEERAAGRALVESGEATRTAYLEWSAPEKADYTKPATWLGCMPALCPTPGPCTCSRAWRHTVTLETLAAELQSAQSSPAKLAEWLRAYMNWTRDDDEVAPDPNLAGVLEAWNLLGDVNAQSGPVLACSAEINQRRDQAAICAAGEGADGPDGPRLLAVLEHGVGIDWLLGRILDIDDRLRPVAWAIDERSPAATLREPLRQKGITVMSATEPHDGGLWIPGATDVAAAAAGWADAVRHGTVVHRDQTEMSDGLAGARSRNLGDGGWAFGRKVSSDDITCPVASSLALAAYERFKHLAVDYDVLQSVH